MSFFIELPQTYTFSFCIDQENRTLVDTTFEVPATEEGIAKASRTIQQMMNEYAPAIKTPEVTIPTLVTVDETVPVPTPFIWEYLVKRSAGQKRDKQAEPADAPPLEKKSEGARGRLRIICPECGNTFGTFLREYQTEVACKCGHQINLTGQLGRYHFNCPYCQYEGWGKTNSEDPDITVRCKCGRDVELCWEPKEKEYQN